MLARSRWPHVRLGAVLALAITAAVAAWLVLRGDDGNESATPTTPAATMHPQILSLSALEEFGATTAQPIFWVGRQQGRRYELRQTRDRIYLRYLPPGVAAGTRKEYLTVATYRVRNAFAATRAASRFRGAAPLRVASGGIAFYSRNRPTSVYLAYRGSDVQVEVFHPVGRIAQRLVVTGRVEPIRASR